MVERDLRKRGVCELRLWAQPWYDAHTGKACRVTVKQRNTMRTVDAMTLFRAACELAAPEPAQTEPATDAATTREVYP